MDAIWMDERWAVKRRKERGGGGGDGRVLLFTACCQVVTEGRVCGWWKLHRPPSLVGQYQLEVSGIVIGAKR